MLAFVVIFVILACMSKRKFWKTLFWIIAILACF